MGLAGAIVCRPLISALGPRLGDGAVTVAVLKELVSEHLQLSRKRLGSAEARIAILEERLAFYEELARPALLARPKKHRNTTIETLGGSNP